MRDEGGRQKAVVVVVVSLGTTLAGGRGRGRRKRETFRWNKEAALVFMEDALLRVNITTVKAKAATCPRIQKKI